MTNKRVRSQTRTMQDSSTTPHMQDPSTPGPSTRRYPTTLAIPMLNYQPMNSSPLAESPRSSPVTAAQRRRSGYKPNFPPLGGLNLNTGMGRVSSSAEEPQKAFLRERFRARCFERAMKDRDRARRRSRSSYGSVSGGSSDGDEDAEMDTDGEEDPEIEDENVTMQDELFRRIMENTSRKRTHNYRLSYAYDVGSSVDPDIEDVGRWENELQEEPRSNNHAINVTPADLDDEELQAYAEDYAALADFEDVDWDASDLEDAEPTMQGSIMDIPIATGSEVGNVDHDVDMS